MYIMPTRLCMMRSHSSQYIIGYVSILYRGLNYDVNIPGRSRDGIRVADPRCGTG